ncbi:MAG: histidine kinase [Octadecabacter sp.]|nr:histidine kinase [Octadecabacter sp.]
MNATRFAILGIVMSAVIAGFLMYYQLVYAGYEEINAEQFGALELTSVVTGEPEPVYYDNFQAIDTTTEGVRLSGAISFRACFDTVQSQALLSETYVMIDDAVPLTAPSWFDCFDAQAIGAALEDGDALAFMGQENIYYGVDRVVAVYPDGRGFVWHQINHCGEAVFAGDNTPEDCPEPPASAGEN